MRKEKLKTEGGQYDGESGVGLRRGNREKVWEQKPLWVILISNVKGTKQILQVGRNFQYDRLWISRKIRNKADALSALVPRLHPKP